MPQITIAIPTYNRASWLKEALLCVSQQTYQDFDLIVADNASDDETQQVVAGFNRPGLRYYRHPHNMGMVENFKFCANAAQTEWIVIHQDDDFLSPLFLDRWHNAIQRHPEIVMFATEVGLTSYSDGKRFWQLMPRCLPLEHRWDQPQPRILPGLQVAALQFVHTGFLFPAVAIRTEILRDSFLEATYFMDRYMNFRAGCTGPVAYEAFIGAIWRGHPGQASATLDGTQATIQNTNTMLRYFAEHHMDWQGALREIVSEFSLAARVAWTNELMTQAGVPAEALAIVAEEPARNKNVSVEKYLAQTKGAAKRDSLVRKTKNVLKRILRPDLSRRLARLWFRYCKFRVWWRPGAQQHLALGYASLRVGDLRTAESCFQLADCALKPKNTTSA